MMSMEESGRLEEERRLAYVGVTRAMQKLTLTYAETRRLYGKEVYHRPSRFIGELPPECVEEVRLRATVSRLVNHQRLGTPITANDSGYTSGSVSVIRNSGRALSSIWKVTASIPAYR